MNTRPRGSSWTGIAAAMLLFGCVSNAAVPVRSGATHLRVDNLSTPLGIDDPTPSFSWQLLDQSAGARQTAYEVVVASAPELLGSASPDIWKSGRVESDGSLNVRYAGPALKPSTRYYWTVKVWGAKGAPYQAALPTWFETGLMSQAAWNSEWIGYETTEEDAVRRAPAKWIVAPEYRKLDGQQQFPHRFAYRAHVTLDKPVKKACLYATGEDTVSAWLNGRQVLEAQPFPAWHQMPWKKFVRADVSGEIAAGENTIALEGVQYSPASPGGPPVIATLFVEYTDESVATFASGTEWKASIDAQQGWERKGFDDSGWKTAEELKQNASGADTPVLGSPWIPDTVKELRHSFQITKPVRSARLYSTALGGYEAFLNGKPVSEDRLAPGWTDYREHVKYQTYDVTALLHEGANALGVLLAPGWYATSLEWFQQPNNYGATPPTFRGQMRVEYADGSVEWIKTDRHWMAHTSYVLKAELYDGETQDARAFDPKWSTAAFTPSGWKNASAIEPQPVRIEAQDFQPIRVERTMPAKAVTEPKSGVYVFDFGQNLAGVEHLRISGPKGTDVQLRFAEILNDDGTIYVENLRTAKATDHFILAGTGTEEFTPKFTFHGFRYAELTGVTSSPAKDALTVEVIHTSAPFSTEMKTGSAMVNQLWSNILWGQRSNFVGVPTDCPQRDERLGWMADAQVFWRTASYNMDLAAFSRKFGGDMRGTQVGTDFYGIYAPGTVRENAGWGAGWSDAGVIIPWTSWLQTGDAKIIDENWDAMTRYVAAIETANPDGLWAKEQGIAFGDWLSPEGKTDQTLIATAEWAYDATLLQQMAEATGRTGDALKYAAMFQKIRTAFQKKFVREDGFVMGADHTPSPFGERNKPTEGSAQDTQTGYVLALHMSLLPQQLRAAAAQKLVDKIRANHGLLATGFLGTPYLLEELTKSGHADVAFTLLLNTQYPSWGYLVEHGATTTWERWNGDQMKSDPSMNSYNHYAYGAVADWIYRFAAGVDASPKDPGFHTVVLHPVFDARFGSMSFAYRSAYGTIQSEWSVAGDAVEWKITIPANSTGWLGDAEMKEWQLKPAGNYDGRVVESANADGEQGLRLESGTYEFAGRLKATVATAH